MFVVFFVFMCFLRFFSFSHKKVDKRLQRATGLTLIVLMPASNDVTQFALHSICCGRRQAAFYAASSTKALLCCRKKAMHYKQKCRNLQQLWRVLGAQQCTVACCWPPPFAPCPYLVKEIVLFAKYFSVCVCVRVAKCPLKKAIRIISTFAAKLFCLLSCFELSKKAKKQ